MPDLATRYGGPSLNFASTPASSQGIAVTCAGSNNTKGSWVELVASTVGNTSFLIVSMTSNDSVGFGYLVDIGIGPAASEVVLIPNLFVYSASTRTISHVYTLPIAIPAGTRISARAQSTTASKIVLVSLHTIAPTLDSPSPLGQVEANGVSTAATTLTAIDPGGTAHVDSSWVQIVASTGFNYRWLCIVLVLDSTTTASVAEWLCDIAIGGAGSEVEIFSDLPHTLGNGGDTNTSLFCVPANIPAGTRIAARARCNINTATARILDVAVWGVG